MCIVGGLFAQSIGARNWISVEANILGAGLQYERMLTGNFSIGGSTYMNTWFLLWLIYSFQAQVRYYPFANGLYAELGLGYGWVSGFLDLASEEADLSFMGGFMLNPALGWRIDFGKPGGFFINPQISVPLVFGKQYTVSGNNGFRVNPYVKASFSFGFAF
jgi:hypothetical protein